MSHETPVSHFTVLYFQDKIESIEKCLKVIAVTLIIGLLFSVVVVAHAEKWLG